MQYFFSPGVYAGVVEQQLIVADLLNDRFVGLHEDLTPGLRTFVATDPRLKHSVPEGIAHLLNGKYLTTDATSGRAFSTECPLVPKPITSVNAQLPANDWTISVSDILRVAADHWKSKRIIHELSLLEKIASPIAQQERISGPQLRGLVERYQRANVFSPFHGNCFVQSLSLCMLLRRLGIGAKFIIGVRALPFAAHSWVQHEETVLADEAESVRTYQPLVML